MGKRVANEFWRLTRFSVVGVLAIGVYIIAAMIAVEAAGVAPVVGSIVGYCASFLVSYIGHLRFTFAVPGRYRDYVLKAIVGSAAAFFVSTVVMWMATKILRIDFRVALVAVAIIVPICSYLVNRFWVFLHPADADPAGQPIKTV